ncbi:MAG: M99 family carboxypeptidase catalytic domain-containing protein [Thermodesulfobacteriota bacterium]
MKPCPSPARSLGLLLLLLACPALARADVPSFTFFAGTQYELKAYFLRGDAPGPTVMIQGGIQGDEVSGFLAAQALTRSSVRRGNLVVIPRANLPSVNTRRRQVNVDLNRRFDREYGQFYEDRLARVIRFLLGGCDAFIHMHEGSGFYHPTYVNVQRNPGRYGQSIIIDTTVYQDRIHLAQAVNQVLGRLNGTIAPADYQFRLFNTDTFAANTAYPEQRKSLTYYALSQVGIPALAIEVSKSIDDLGWKVKQQLKAAQLFLDHFGVEVDLPYVNEEEISRYLKSFGPVTVNGRTVRAGETLHLTLSPGETLQVNPPQTQDASFHPSPAVLASDRPDFNVVGTPRLVLAPFSTLDVRADGSRLAKVAVRMNATWKDVAEAKAAGSGPLFAVWLNKKLRFVPAGRTLDAVAGDQLVLEGIWSGRNDEVLNLKGFVSSPFGNRGQDMGQEIILDAQDFISSYVEQAGENWLCRVVRETRGVKRAEFTIRVAPRRIQAVQFRDPDGHPVLVHWKDGGQKDLPPGEYRLEDLWSNGPRDKVVVTQGQQTLPWGGILRLAPGEARPLTLRQATTFKPIGEMVLRAPNS